jgi:steroid delta-isomerase-like uncharacterized protein
MMDAAERTSSMATDENKEIARRFAQVWNKGGTEIIDELAAPDLVVSYPLLPEDLHGPEAFKQCIVALYNAFPDLGLRIDDLIAEGDKVAGRWTIWGTHQGDLPGLPATGKRAEWTGITIYRIVDGKVVEERGEEDALGALQQLGVIPTAEQARA